MKQPYMNMSKPLERDYLERPVQISIYSYYEKYRHEDYEEDDEDDEEDSQYTQDNEGEPDGVQHWWSGERHQPKTPKVDISKINLQFLLDLVPKSVSPADIKMRFSIDSGDMGIYGHEITFYYNTTVPAEPEKFKEDHAKWAKLYAEYEVKDAAYQEWEAQKDIENKQAEIRRLSEQLRKLKK